MTETQSSNLISTKLERIAKLVKEIDAPLTTLAHNIDVDWLREAHRRTRKDGGRGVDGVSAKQYGERLEENLASLLDRAKTGTYRAPPVRRVMIPKGDGTQMRPIGVPTFEDKVLQRAVAMVVEAIYEPLFLRLLVRVSTGALGARCESCHRDGGSTHGRRLDLGGRHPKVFRHSRSRPPARHSSLTDT